MTKAQAVILLIEVGVIAVAALFGTWRRIP
jgi:hypothetical protein